MTGWGVHDLVVKFLSTLSLRRATPTAQALEPQLQNFYPRSPCGERPASVLTPSLPT